MIASFSDMIKANVASANEKFSLFGENDRILVGFSGGADSLTLIFVLYEMLGADKISALHVNHMLRGADADADEEFCRKFCSEHGIHFSAVRIDVASLCGGVGVEEKARELRYAALREEAKNERCSKIALAHTASDNIETVIFNLVRGAGLSGMRGIPPKRPEGEAEIIRPLILCTREEIEGYTREKGLSFRTDATNSDTHYTRNFIRHEIVPLLKKINPLAEQRVSSSSSLFAEDEKYLSETAKGFINKNGIEDSCDISLLMSLPSSIRVRVISVMYGNLTAESLEAKHFSDIEKLLQTKRNGARIILPGKTAALIKNGKIYFIQECNYKKLTSRKEFSYNVPFGERVYENGFATFLSDGDIPDATLEKLAKNATFKARTRIPESTAKILTARSRKNGEKYIFGGMTRTLKKLVSGESEKAKTMRPVFCDKDGIIWFPPFRIRDDVYKSINGKTCVLYYFEY
ncbi:MAG: tRNA lysidine(34) synthetase TilS [Eubacteriales bacterium]